MLLCISSETFMNIAVGFSAIFTPILAIWGFSQWRREALGKDKYNISRNVLLSLFKVQNSVRITRSRGFIDLVNIMAQGERDASIKLYGGIKAEYEKRIHQLSDDTAKLKEGAFELKALGDKITSDKIDELLLHVYDLFTHYEAYFHMRMNPVSPEMEESQDLQADIGGFEKILFSSGEGDDFNSKFNNLVKECEAPLRKNIS